MDRNYNELLDRLSQLSDVVLAMIEENWEFRSLLMKDRYFVQNAAKHRDILDRYIKTSEKTSEKMKEFLISLEKMEDE